MKLLKKTWSKDNDMRVNASKTHELCIDFSRNNFHSSLEPHIIMDDSVIDRVDTAKILGVTISSDLIMECSFR
jgi:hypothetical protein